MDVLHVAKIVHMCIVYAQCIVCACVDIKKIDLSAMAHHLCFNTRYALLKPLMLKSSKQRIAKIIRPWRHRVTFDSQTITMII